MVPARQPSEHRPPAPGAPHLTWWPAVASPTTGRFSSNTKPILSIVPHTFIYLFIKVHGCVGPENGNDLNAWPIYWSYEHWLAHWDARWMSARSIVTMDSPTDEFSGCFPIHLLFDGEWSFSVFTVFVTCAQLLPANIQCGFYAIVCKLFIEKYGLVTSFWYTTSTCHENAIDNHYYKRQWGVIYNDF